MHDVYYDGKPYERRREQAENRGDGRAELKKGSEIARRGLKLSFSGLILIKEMEKRELRRRRRRFPPDLKARG
jgi:hypothetical protein